MEIPRAVIWEIAPFGLCYTTSLWGGPFDGEAVGFGPPERIALAVPDRLRSPFPATLNAFEAAMRAREDPRPGQVAIYVRGAHPVVPRRGLRFGSVYRFESIAVVRGEVG